MIRRGGTYGPPLPEAEPEDGVERGIAAFVGCASLVRQFEFAMNVWVNDPKFEGLENERDPFVGTHDGTFDMTIPKRPIGQKIKGLPAFTTLRGGAYFFLPGKRGLRYLATLKDARELRVNVLQEKERFYEPIQICAEDVQPDPGSTEIHARKKALQHLLDVELSVGVQSRCDRTRQSILDHDRGPQGGLAHL
jgi:hypothetical protein